MGFPSKDGFFVTLDGIVEFRVMEEQAALVYVNYNDIDNGEAIDEEIVAKIILPNARSFCRLRGSSHLGKDFFGEERGIFQAEFEQALKKTCLAQGIDIRQALITKNQPPTQIIDPIKERQIALQTEKQYQREILEQKSKQELAVETETVKQKQALVAAEQEVVKVVTEAKRKQEVALIEANQRLTVAEFQLKAAKDQAAAVLARGQAAADVIGFNNEAEAAGWKRSVEAFDGDGAEFARWTMLKKLAPSYRGMMINTDDSPLMDVFNAYQVSAMDGKKAPSVPKPVPAATDNQ